MSSVLPISFSCPRCSTNITTEVEHAGLAADCPACGAELIVPGAGHPSVNVAPARLASEDIKGRRSSSNLRQAVIILVAVGITGLLAAGGLAYLSRKAKSHSIPSPTVTEENSPVPQPKSDPMNPTGAFEQAGLGFKYRKGDGVVKDDAEAARWFTKFAEQGFVLAQPQLAQCYLNGEGVEKSYAEFVKWTKRAAEQGLPESQVHLGLALASGMEITKDLKTAYMWFNIAAASGNPEAKKKAEKFRSEVARSMSQSDIAEAQRMSRMWKPKSEPQS